MIAETLAPNHPLLGSRLAAACAAAWQEARSEALTVEWLSARGIEDVKVARTVFRLFGDKAVSHLGENPYCLVPLLSWSKVDATGLQLLGEMGVERPRQDRRRLVGAVDASVKRMLKENATAISDHGLRQTLEKVLGSSSAVGPAIEAGAANHAILPGQSGTWRAPGAAVMED